MMKKSREITVTLNRRGIATSSAWIPILNPLFLLATLKGLKILSSLNILTNLNLLPVTVMDTTDMITTNKSMMFHPLRMYEISPLNKNPWEMIFSTPSPIKKEVRTISAFIRKSVRVLFGSFRGLSRARFTLEKAIRRRMNESNSYPFTIRST